MAKFQIFVDIKKEYRFRFRASGNHKIIFTSEWYIQKQGCLNGIESVKINSRIPERYKLWKDKDGKNSFWFTMVGWNWEPLWRGETYTTRRERDDGVDIMKSQTYSASVEEL